MGPKRNTSTEERNNHMLREMVLQAMLVLLACLVLCLVATILVIGWIVLVP